MDGVGEHALDDQALPPRLANALYDSFFGRDITASCFRDLIDASPADCSQRPPSRCRSRTRRSGRPDSRTALCPRQTTDESGRTSSRRRGRGRPFENRVDAARSRKREPDTEPRASDFVRGMGVVEPAERSGREGRSRPARVPRSRGTGVTSLKRNTARPPGQPSFSQARRSPEGAARRILRSGREARRRWGFRSASAASRGVSRSSRDSAPGPG